MAEVGIADTPAACTADALREHGAWPQQDDDFGKWIHHFWTMANKIWIFNYRSSALGAYRGSTEPTEDPAMKTVLITGCSSGYGLDPRAISTRRAGTWSPPCVRRVKKFCPGQCVCECCRLT